MKDLSRHFFTIYPQIQRYAPVLWVVFCSGLGFSLINSLLWPDPAPWLGTLKMLVLLLWIQALCLLVFLFIYRERRSARATGEEQFFYWVVEWGGGVVCIGVVFALFLVEVGILISLI